MATVLPQMLPKNKGFTLIEVIMAMLILMVGMLGLLEAVNVAIEHNLKNQLREEAVNLGQRTISELKGKKFDDILASYSAVSVPSKIRGTSRTYTVTRTSTVLATENLLPTSKQLEVVVSWNYKGVTFQNRVTTPVSILR